MEKDSWYSDASTSDEEDEVNEDEVGVNNTIETGMPQDRGTQLLYAGTYVRGQREATIKGTAAQNKHVPKVIKQVDPLMLEAEYKAAITENIMEESDALRRETEMFLAQCEERFNGQDQLKSLTQSRKDITEDRDFLLSDVQSTADDKVIISKDKDAMKFEANNFRALPLAAAILEQKINDAKLQYDSIRKERAAFKSRYQRSELNINDIRKVVEDLKIETQNLRFKIKDYASLEKELNTVKQQCENIKKERNVVILRVQKITKSIEFIRRQIDALNLERESLRNKIKEAAPLENQLNAARLLCDNIGKERDFYNLKLQEAARERGVMIKDIHALKLKKEKLLTQCEKSALLEKQLEAVSQDCENMRKERNAFISREERMAVDRKAMRKEIITLRLEEENLRTQLVEEKGN